MKKLEYKLRELKLSNSVTNFSVSFGVNRPYVRIVKNGDTKIAKVLLILDNNTTINNIETLKENGDKNPFTNKANIHFIVNINLKFTDHESAGFKIVEVEIKNEDILEEHFNDINSFMIVSCSNNKNILGTMTIASYQNGGSFDPPPLH
ncbi:hypothetical protein [Polaribacter cellanae]|uniref:Uncharacterized protein n=1 Tax=Polaribacter cellanae TaxID=2818493 RepID=A0A975CQW2_9FLAO|nr:hypothetical protein [Polaribacter cellanae]QTE23075.1 hypothetical protein J3359_02020 [Polaribacter cellanae]